MHHTTVLQQAGHVRDKDQLVRADAGGHRSSHVVGVDVEGRPGIAPAYRRKDRRDTLVHELAEHIRFHRYHVPNPPKVGAVRTTRPPQPGRTYFMLFGNPARFVKPGNKVAVMAGDFKADNLVVE